MRYHRNSPTNGKAKAHNMTKLNTNLAPATSQSLSNTTGNDTPVYSAEDLTAGGNLAQIRLSEALYTLRITRQGKLILTK